MFKVVYPTILFGILWWQLKRKNSNVNDTTVTQDIIDRINNLERGFIFLDRDINNGLEGGTSVSTNNRVVDGVANPIYRMKTIRSGFIGQTLKPNILGVIKTVGVPIPNEGFARVTINDESKFVTHLIKERESSTSIGRTKLTDFIRREFNINSLYRRVINLDKTMRGSYRERVSSGAGGGSSSVEVRQFATDKLWRYGQLIIGRSLPIDDWHQATSELNVCAPVAVMDHNIDILETPIIHCNVGTHVLGLDLERETSNVLVVCDEGCTIPEAYLKCDFKTTELGSLQMRRAKGYSYLEIPTDAIKAKRGDLSLIFKLKTTVTALVYHQLGGV